MAKRGPVPRGNYPNKSRVLSTRIRADTRQALESAASASRRSLSQEIEHRLRRSFGDDRIISEKYGNRQNYALLGLLSQLFEAAPGPTTSWLHDPENFNHVVHSINAVLTALRPPSAATEPSNTDMFLGNINAAALADELAAADASMPLTKKPRRLDYIKADLGEIADRLKPLEGGGVGHGERARKRKTT
jgi:hypothetical protein